MKIYYFSFKNVYQFYLENIKNCKTKGQQPGMNICQIEKNMSLSSNLYSFLYHLKTFFWCLYFWIFLEVLGARHKISWSKNNTDHELEDILIGCAILDKSFNLSHPQCLQMEMKLLIFALPLNNFVLKIKYDVCEVLEMVISLINFLKIFSQKEIFYEKWCRQMKGTSFWLGNQTWGFKCQIFFHWFLLIIF